MNIKNMTTKKLISRENPSQDTININCNHFDSCQADFFSEKFINLLMKDGKKLKAVKIFFDMLNLLQDRKLKTPISVNVNTESLKWSEKSVLHILSQAVTNVRPSIEVRKVRVAGSTFLVPALLSRKKQETLAIRWIIESAKKRKKNSKLNFSDCLADEITDASKKQGQARSKRDELHKIAEINRASIRYRWW